MLSRSIRLSRRTVSRRLQAPVPIFLRHYADSHFPGDRVESLGPSQRWKVSDAIKEDHRQLKDYYNCVVNSKDLDEQERYGNAFIWELARHSIAEEIVVYPAFERDIKDGRGIADKDRAQHKNVSILDPMRREFLASVFTTDPEFKTSAQGAAIRVPKAQA